MAPDDHHRQREAASAGWLVNRDSQQDDLYSLRILRNNEMKRPTGILALTALIVVAQSGCMCVYAVKTGGTHIRYLQPIAAWTNNAAEVMVECSALDKRVLPDKAQDLGKRFVCASPLTWDAAIKAEFEKQRKNAERYGRTSRIDHVFLRPGVTLTATNAADAFAGSFVLFPPDMAVSSNAEPPGAGWMRRGIPKNSSYPSWLAAVDGETLTIYVDNVGLPEEVRRYKDWWWYPNQLLLIPAYAVDIVTSPIQILVIMHSLGKIGG